MQNLYEIIDEYEETSKNVIQSDYQKKLDEFFTSNQSLINQISDEEIKKDILAAKGDLISNFEKYINNFTNEIKNVFTTLSDLTDQIQKNLEKGFFSSTKSIIMPAIDKIFAKVVEKNIWGIKIYDDIVKEIKQKMGNRIVPKIQDQLQIEKGGIDEIKKIENMLEEKSKDINSSLPRIKEELLSNLKIDELENKIIESVVPEISKFREFLSDMLNNISSGIKEDVKGLQLDPIQFLDNLKKEIKNNETKLVDTQYRESLANGIKKFTKNFTKEFKFESLNIINEISDSNQKIIDKINKKDKKSIKITLSDESVANFEQSINKFTVNINADFSNLIQLSSKIRDSLDFGYSKTRQSIILPEIGKIFDEITEEKIFDVDVFNEIVNDIRIRMELDFLIKIENELLDIKVDLSEVKNIKSILEQKSNELSENLPKNNKELLKNLKTVDISQKINEKIISKLNNIDNSLKQNSEKLKNEINSLNQNYVLFFDKINEQITPTEQISKKTEQDQLYTLLTNMIKVDPDVKPRIKKVQIELPATDRAKFLTEQINNFLEPVPTSIESSIVFVDQNGNTQTINSKQDIVETKEENVLLSSTSFENTFDVTLKDVNINDIVPYGYKVNNYSTMGFEKEPTKKLLDSGLELSWIIPEIEPGQEAKIQLELERRVSRTVLFNIGDETSTVNTWFNIEPFKTGYAATSSFSNFQDRNIENLIINDEIPNTYKICEIKPLDVAYYLKMDKAGFDQIIGWQYSTIESGNKIEHFYYLLVKNFLILSKFNVKSKKDKPILEFIRIVEPNFKFYEETISYYIKFYKYIPELYIKEIIPENLNVTFQLPSMIEKSIEIQDKNIVQIWKILPEIGKNDFKFGYICSGTSIKSELPIEIYIPQKTISISKQTTLEPESKFLFIPELHEKINENKRKSFN